MFSAGANFTLNAPYSGPMKNLRNRNDSPPEVLYLNVPARGKAVRATDYFHRLLLDVTTETIPDNVTRAYWGPISRRPGKQWNHGPRNAMAQSRRTRLNSDNLCSL